MCISLPPPDTEHIRKLVASVAVLRAKSARYGAGHVGGACGLGGSAEG